MRPREFRASVRPRRPMATPTAAHATAAEGSGPAIAAVTAASRGDPAAGPGYDRQSKLNGESRDIEFAALVRVLLVRSGAIAAVAGGRRRRPAVGGLLYLIHGQFRESVVMGLAGVRLAGNLGGRS
jgi:hypothetical protein